MKPAFHVTYDIVSPESALCGDTESGGFVLADGSHCELPANVYGQAAGVIKADCALSFRQAVALINTAAIFDNGDSFYEDDSRVDYRTGEEERRALHVPRTCTAASYQRIRRALGLERPKSKGYRRAIELRF